MQNCSDDAEEVELLRRREADNVQGILEQSPLFAIVDAVDFASALVQVLVVLYTAVQQQGICTSTLARHVASHSLLPTFQTTATFHELVEYMETPLSFAAHDDSAFLEQVPVNVRAGNAAVWREANPDELSESTGVVVALCLRVTKGLKDWISP